MHFWVIAVINHLNIFYFCNLIRPEQIAIVRPMYTKQQITYVKQFLNIPPSPQTIHFYITLYSHREVKIWLIHCRTIIFRHTPVFESKVQRTATLPQYVLIQPAQRKCHTCTAHSVWRLTTIRTLWSWRLIIGWNMSTRELSLQVKYGYYELNNIIVMHILTWLGACMLF